MNPWIKVVYGTAFSLLSSLAVAMPPLPVAGDLTDQNGQPLNGTVKLTFSISDSADTSARDLWSEIQDKVSVVAGRFTVLLGVKIRFPKEIDFTQEKYIKVTVEREGRPAYTLAPPLVYTPTLGAWQANHAKQATQADNASKLESHPWSDIKAKFEAIETELNKLRDELVANREKLSAAESRLATVSSQLDTANSQLDTAKKRLNLLENFQVEEKKAIQLTFVGGPQGQNCPQGWDRLGKLLLMYDGSSATAFEPAMGADTPSNWPYTHPILCKRAN